MQDKKPDVPVSDGCSLVIVTTPEYVKNAIEEHAKSRNHPYATQAEPGFVTLSNDVDSDSEITVATSKAVKEVYDLASKANCSNNNYVPNSRRVNGKALSSDIALNASDVGAYTKEETDSQINNVTSLANTANQNADTRLAKDQNGADIPDKEKFVKNLGLGTLMEGIALPVGVPVPWPTEAPPEGWFICNGDSFDKAKYPKLAIAYPSGVLPDLRGEFIRGWDNGRGVDAGRHLLSNQAEDVAPHNHRIQRMWSRSTAGAEDLGTGNGIFNSVHKDINYGADPRGLGIAIGIGSGGYGYMDNVVANSTGKETRPRNIAFNYIVRAA
ncbi:tail protein [Xenorhabdus beddingii]|uniref:Tail protein n=1 Tax=Xenorhabdus beddingii TaxID=40578 RepID=A0A1Y2SM39_9GAMM|nr:phage tail protein [Xenorhabdus beddingii]OTA19986.1 tail protein [Xenorhabdus beddingii]